MVSVEKRRDQLPFKSCEVPTFDMPRSWHEKRGTTLPSFHLRSPERRSQRSNAREPASVGTGWASAANGAQLRCAGLGLGLTPGTLVPAGATRRGRICQNRGWPKKNVFFFTQTNNILGVLDICSEEIEAFPANGCRMHLPQCRAALGPVSAARAHPPAQSLPLGCTCVSA